MKLNLGALNSTPNNYFEVLVTKVLQIISQELVGENFKGNHLLDLWFYRPMCLI